MNSSKEFHLDCEVSDGDYDFFDPTEFRWKFKTEKKESDDGNPVTFNFNVGDNESTEEEVQIVPNEASKEEIEIVSISTQPSEAKKNEKIGGFRSSQTPCCSKSLVDEINVSPQRSAKRETNPKISSDKASNISTIAWKPEVVVAKEGKPLVPISRIPLQYRSVFEGYESFNILQSMSFNGVFTTDKPVVVSAPTSSGKTAIFELAIIRLLIASRLDKRKVLFMAPTKAVVNEKCRDWGLKFSKFGVTCLEVTGDSDIEDYKVLQKASIIFTTPEKWDSLTRKAQEMSQVVNAVSLVLIDEVHCLNDDGRGATMEVVISRMKTINQKRGQQKMRFIAVSATIPNAEDIALWLGTRQTPSVVFILPSDLRPVTLQNIVLGYRCADSENNFQFEKKLSYRVPEVIQKYSSGKPTLIFVPTRTSAVATAQQIVKSMVQMEPFVRDLQQKRELIALSNTLQDKNLKALVTHGIGFHHAGLSYGDRTEVLDAFSNGRIMVLCCTTTLALGVNIPAHLVIIKATFLYMAGVCSDLPESQVLQMIGRAGRPQFDTSAVAVIMTKEKLKSKYEKMLNGTQIIESFLHKHLAEHINAEIVLKTITDVTVACEWIHSTFLYIRVLKNKAYYGIDVSWDEKAVEKKLQEWCIKELNGLRKFHLITMDDDCAAVISTEIGKVMARYCVSVESMKRFMQLKGGETIKELLELVSFCDEVTQEIRLRNPEKTLLNSYNEASKNDPNKEIIRYPLNGKIKTPSMKANCLMQVVLGNIKIEDHSLYQDAKRILKCALRVVKCLFEYLMTKETGFHLLVNVCLLAKCLRAGLWEDSPYVTRQLSVQSREVSVTVSRDIAAGGLTTFEAIESVSPQTIEMFTKKQSPYGNILYNVVRKLPRYEIEMQQLCSDTPEANEDGDYFVTLQIKVFVSNFSNIRNDFDEKHSSLLFVGNVDNGILHRQRIYDKILLRNNGEFQTEVNCRPSQVANKVFVRFVSESIVGIDIYRDFYPKFDEANVSKYFSTANRRIKLPLNNPNIPKELKFFENWKHICNENCGHPKVKQGKDGSVSFTITNNKEIENVESVKRKNCRTGPMDQYIDNREPQPKVDDDEMMSDPEFDALLAKYEFPKMKGDKQKQQECDKKTCTENAESAEPNISTERRDGSQEIPTYGTNTFDFSNLSVYNFEETRKKALETATEKRVSEICLKDGSRRRTDRAVTESSNSNWKQYEDLYRKRTQSTNYGTYSSSKKFRLNKNTSSQKEKTKTSFTFDNLSDE